MRTTINLLEYLGIPAEEKNELELYGTLPLDLEAVHQKFTEEQEVKYHFDEKTTARGIKDAVYLAAESDGATIELHSPSILLQVGENFSLTIAAQLCDQYHGASQFVALQKLLDEQIGLADPGEYLVLSFPKTSLPNLLADPQLLQVCQEFASIVESQMEKKIRQSAERLVQLRNLGIEETLELDYLDVRHSSPNFISFDEPRDNMGVTQYHYFNRNLGQINTLYQGERQSGTLTLRQQLLTSEAKDNLQQKLEGGAEIFYLRNWEKVMLKEYLEREINPSKQR